MTARSWLGLDIGGANLKAADGRQFARCDGFPLWQRPDRLREALGNLLACAPWFDALAVTMTGELADCFRTKAEGVGAIVAAARHVAGDRALRFYRSDGRWCGATDAAGDPLAVAAANWHALARFAARYADAESSLLIDVGSTTTDIIPIEAGRPSARGLNDPDRLLCGELVYTGVRRSPVCAITDKVPWRGGHCRLAQELFATTGDVYLVLGRLADGPGPKQGIAGETPAPRVGDAGLWAAQNAGETPAPLTADGRPASFEFAYERLARAVCADRTLASIADVVAVAQAVAEAQEKSVAEAIDAVVGRMARPPRSVVVSGCGEFLARSALARSGVTVPIRSLGERLGPKFSVAATAHALATLAAEDDP